jgi:hypothetical protein
MQADLLSTREIAPGYSFGAEGLQTNRLYRSRVVALESCPEFPQTKKVLLRLHMVPLPSFVSTAVEGTELLILGQVRGERAAD